MALIKQGDWPTMRGSLLSDFFDDDVLFKSPMGRQRMPSVNIRETDKFYELEMAAPGYGKQDFNISVENNILTVSAGRKHEEEKKDDHYTRREFGYESFSRSFSLPSNTSEEDIRARYEDGILKLTINKKDAGNGRNKKAISVQ